MKILREVKPLRDEGDFMLVRASVALQIVKLLLDVEDDIWPRAICFSRHSAESISTARTDLQENLTATASRYKHSARIDHALTPDTRLAGG
jgi:hypothetical protein